MTKELKSCPFCGGTKVDIKYNWNNKPSIICLECGSSSAFYDTDEEAIATWNNRYIGEDLRRKIAQAINKAVAIRKHQTKQELFGRSVDALREIILGYV